MNSISIKWLADKTKVSRSTFYNRGFDEMTPEQRVNALAEMATEYDARAASLRNTAYTLQKVASVAKTIIGLDQ